MTAQIRITRRNQLIAFITLCTVYIFLPLLFINTPYVVFIMTQMLFFTIFAYSFNFLFGFTRQLFLCIGAFAGIGAYITGILLRESIVGVVESVILSTLTVGFIGWFVSYLSVRRRLVVIFTGIFTLAITLAFNNLVIGLVDITGGETGFRVRLVSLGLLDSLPLYVRFYYLAAATLLTTAFISFYLLSYTKIGYAFRCIIDDEVSSGLIGIDVAKIKMITAVLASGLLGYAGALYGLFSQLITPSYYGFLSLDIPVQLIVILGGRATLLGPFIGSAIISILNEALKFLGPLTQVLYGLILVLLLAFFRNGIVDFVKRRIVPWFF